MIDETNQIENDLASNLKPFLSQVNILGLEPNSLSSPSQLGQSDYSLQNLTEIPLQSKVQVNSISQQRGNVVDTLTGLSLNTHSSFTSTAASYQTLATSSAITPVNYAIKAQGLVTFNSQSNLDINPLDPHDDALIYAGLGFTLNGNTTLAVQRGVNGQPLTNSQGKFLLVDKALVVAAGYQQATVNGNNNYANLTSPQIVPAENVNLPTYNSLKTEALANYNTANPSIVNINQSPINNATQWAQKFPNGTDSNNPKIIRVKGGSLLVPAGVNLSNLIITVESGDLNFNGSGQQLKNVTLITEQGSINLSSVSAENLTVLSNNNIYSNGNIQFKGSNLFANSKNTGVINFNGQTSGDNNHSLDIVAAGNLTFNAQSNIQGSYLVGKDFTTNGKATIKGNLGAKGNIKFNGQVSFTRDSYDPLPTITANLVNDTGISNLDVITADPSLTGQVTGQITSFKAGLDLTPQANYQSILPKLQSNGTFNLTSADLNQLFGSQLPDGNHSLYLVAQNQTGNQSTPFTFNFTLDTSTSTPTLVLNPSSDTGISNSDRITSQLQPVISGTAEPTAVIRLFDGTQNIAQTNVGSNGQWQITTPSLPNGNHPLTVVSTDIAGNISQPSTALNLTIDSIAPQLQLSQTLDNAQLVNNSHLVGQVNGTGSTVVSASYQWAGTTAIPLTITNQSFNNQIDFTGITNGTKQLTIALLDAAGNSFTQTYNVIVALDKQAPQVNLNLANDTGAGTTDRITNNPNISGTVTDSSGIQSAKVSFQADLSQSLDITSLLQPDGSFTLDRTFLTQLNGGQLPDANYQLYIQAVDIYGNTSTTQNLAFQLLTIATTPTNLQLAPSSDTGTNNSDNITLQAQPTITGQSPIGEQIELLDGTTVIGSTTVGSNGQWEIKTPTLIDGIHSLSARGTDIAGNISPLSTALNITIDTIAPQIQFSQQLEGIVLNASSRLQGQVIDTNTVVVSYQIDGAPAITVPSGNQIDELFNLTGINDGSHQLTVTATDLPGNITTHTYGVTVATGPLLTLALLNDTGNNNTDGITSDPTIRGLVANRQAISRLEIALDDSTNYADLTVTLQLDGSFRLVPAQLDSLAGGQLALGLHTLRVRGVLTDGTVIATATLNFTYQPSSLSTPTLTLATTSDSGTRGDLVTALDRVDLIARTLAGTTVTLGTTSQVTDSNGSATFRGVNLASGANIFTLTATDSNGEIVTSNTTITRSAPFDVILTWNQITLAAIRRESISPPAAARILAMVHTAMYDAVNAIEQKYELYRVDANAPTDTDKIAAAASAAARILTQIYPNQRALFSTSLAQSLNNGATETAIQAGITLGNSVAASILAWRSTDGSRTAVAYTPNAEVGSWQPTLPNFDGALLPQWGNITTFALTKGNQFRPDGLPSLTSDEYTQDFNEVKNYGALNSQIRTTEEAQIAQFWADGSGSYTPAGHWNEIASTASSITANSIIENARLFAQLNIALADAAIAAWDTKYTYNSWRPITAIRAADKDNNSNTTPDPNWQPLINTPPFPEYVSGHSTFSGAAAAVLTKTFGENFNFSSGSVSLPNTSRNFNSFNAAATEAGQSRIYGGIHFQFANRDGLTLGNKIGNYVVNHFLEDDTNAPIQVSLAVDTGVFGTTNRDRITKDTTIKGQVNSTLPNLKLEAALYGQQFVDVSDTVGADGKFILSLSRLQAIAGTSIPDGVYQWEFRLVDTAGDIQGTNSLNITLDTTPALVTLNTLGNVSPTVQVLGTIRDNNGSAGGRVKVDGGTYTSFTVSPDGSFAQILNPLGLSIGVHQLDVEMADTAGNLTNQSTILTVVNNSIYSSSSSTSPGWGQILTNGFSLYEATSLVTQTTINADLGAVLGTRTLDFDLSNNFDFNDTKSLTGDRLAVYLGDNSTPIFSLSETGAFFQPGLVKYDGNHVQIDVSGQPVGSSQVTFQIINGDSDNRSNITVTNFTNTLDPNGTSSPSIPNTTRYVQPGASAVLDSYLSTTNAKLIVNNISFNASTGRYTADLTVQNTGSTPLSNQLAVLLTSLPNGVTVANASGIQGAGSPYLNFNTAIAASGLASGATSDAITVEINNPNSVLFTIKPVFLVGTNIQPPVLTSLSNLTVTVGQKLDIPLVSSGETTSITIENAQLLPTSQLTGDNHLIFRPSPDQVGSYNFTIVARNDSLVTEQNVTLNVLADPITTTRVTGIIADTNQAGIANVLIELSGYQATTNSQGQFTIVLPEGAAGDTLKVYGQRIQLGTITYPFIAEKMPLLLGHEIYRGVNNLIERPIYLPLIDVTTGQTIDPINDTIVTNVNLSGASVLVAANSLFDKNGNAFAGIVSITKVPTNLTPAALPSNLYPDLVVTVQPGDMVFNTPALLSLPNLAGYGAGTLMDLWSINPNTGDFDNVGQGQVSADGSVINTISGGIRNSSWHFFSPPPPPPLDNTPVPGCPDDCEITGEVSSEASLNTGVVMEDYNLVTYQSLGVTRELTLHYDSLRANPTPIVNFNIQDVRDLLAANPKLAATLSITVGNLEYQVPGASGGTLGLSGSGYNFWSLPSPDSSTSTFQIQAALQADLTGQTTGVYSYKLSAGYLVPGIAPNSWTGSLSLPNSSKLVTVNSINSAFGAGWGLQGLQEIVVNSDNSALLVDGDGTELLFNAPTVVGGAYSAPPGDFSTLIKLSNGTFQRTLRDQTVYNFNAQNQLAFVTDPIGNITQYIYNATGLLGSIIDPVGLTTTLTYSGQRVSSITDPTGRVTQLSYDAAGNLMQVKDPNTAKTSWSYDSSHHMTSMTDSIGNYGQDVYDFAGRVTQATLKDGSVVRIAPSQVQGLYAASQTSNPIAAPVAIFFNQRTGSYADGNGNVTNNQIDQFGSGSGSIDGVGPGVTTRRNNQNLVTQTTDARGNTTDYTYDAMGNVLTVQDTISQSTSSFLNNSSLFAHQIYPTNSSLTDITTADLNNDGYTDLIGINSSNATLEVLLGNGHGFNEATTIALISNPVAVTVGELNTDGKLDLVIAYAGENLGLSVLLGQGDGTFGPSIQYGVGANLTSTVIWDLNADAKPDLIAANFLNSTVKVFLNNGNGTFGTETEYTVGNHPNSVVLNDVNGDSIAELITANNYDNTVSILLGNINGTFGTKTDYSVGGSPSSVVLNDINGDGQSDLVVTNSGNVSVLLNNGDGTFGSQTHYFPGGYLKEVQLQDLNNDGKPDLVVAVGLGYGNDEVDVLLNHGDGTFGPPVQYTVNGEIIAIELSDLNGDGKPDLIILQSNTNAISVLLNQGDGLFAAAIDYQVSGSNPNSVTVALVNNDGQVDLVVGYQNSRGVTVLQSNGDGTFIQDSLTNQAAGNAPVSVAVSDLNGDGVLDVVSANSFSNTVSVALGNGDGTIVPLQDYTVGNSPSAVVLADVNGDGKPDLIVANANSNNISIFLGQGNGSFETPVNYSVGFSPVAVVLGDINGDSKSDLIVTNAGSNTVSVLLNNGTGTFSTLTDYTVGNFPSAVVLVDVNGDGKLDVLVTNFFDNTVSVLLGNGNGTFGTLTDYAVGSNPSGLAVGDVNGDSKSDLIVANRESNTVSVLLNNGAGTFSTLTDYTVGNSPSAVVLADVNGDGKLDVLVANRFGNTVSVLLGNGNGTFQSNLQFLVDSNPTSLAVGDFNGDSKLDWVTANSESDNLTISLNSVASSSSNVATLRTYTYDPLFNKVTSYTDELGRRTVYNYDPTTGLLLYVNYVVGTGGVNDVRTNYTYTSRGQLASETDPLGRVTSYQYDSYGRLIKTTFAVGTSLEAYQHFEYDLAGNQTAFIDELGHRTEYQYNIMNLLSKTIDANNKSTLYTYDSMGNQLTVTDPLGHTTTNVYDAMGRLIKTSNANGGVTHNTYALAGNLIATTDPLGHTTEYQYDSRNRLKSTILPDSTTNKFKYDFDNNQTAFIDAKGNPTYSFYDSRGRLVRSVDALGSITRYQYDVANQLISLTDALGHQSQYKYDELGRQIEVIDANNGITKTQYDKAGNVIAETDALGHTTTYQYDSRNRLISVKDALLQITTTNYDAVGNVLSETDANGHTTYYGYDVLNRQTSVTDALTHSMMTVYDANGNVLSQTNALGQTTSYTYDNNGNQTTVTDNLGHTTTTSYDLNNQVIAVTDALSNTTHYGYDTLGRITSVTDANGSITTTTYDLNGNVASLTDPNTNTTTYTYDVLNRLKSETNSLGFSRTYNYDAVGNLITQTDRDGRIRTYSYDVLDRLTAEKWLDGLGNAIHTFTYSYDANGRLIASNDSNSAYQYTYDVVNQLISVDNLGTTGVPHVLLTYTYDAAGNLISTTDSINGVTGATTNYSYDVLNRTTGITQNGVGVSNKRVNYTYDAASQLTGINRYSDLTGTNLVAGSIYGYDNAGRLINLNHSRNGTPLANYSFSYDDANRITQLISAEGTNNYTYDATSQLTSASGTSEAYSYDDNGNRTNSGYSTGSNNQLLSDGTYNYEYDGEGNRTKRTNLGTSEVTSYSWDYRNRLTLVVTTDNNGVVIQQVEYTYDVNNKRISKSITVGVTTEVEGYVYDGNNLVLVFDDSGTETERYLYGIGDNQVLAKENDLGEVLWTLLDHEGTVKDVVDSNGLVLNHIVYDSFGNITSQTDSTVEFRFAYTGQELDKETGLYYYDARYYDSANGRFISVDPIGFEGGDSNLYRYVGNSPTNFVDPSGKSRVKPLVQLWKKLRPLIIGGPVVQKIAENNPLPFLNQPYNPFVPPPLPGNNPPVQTPRSNNPFVRQPLTNNNPLIERFLSPSFQPVPGSSCLDDLFDPFFRINEPPSREELKKVDEKWLKKNRIDAHNVKKNLPGNASQFDIYYDNKSGDLYALPKKEQNKNAPPEYIGNVNDF